MDRCLHDVVRGDVVVARQRQPRRLHRDPGNITFTHYFTLEFITPLSVTSVPKSIKIFKISISKTPLIGTQTRWNCVGYHEQIQITAWMEWKSKDKATGSDFKPVQTQQSVQTWNARI